MWRIRECVAAMLTAGMADGTGILPDMDPKPRLPAVSPVCAGRCGGRFGGFPSREHVNLPDGSIRRAACPGFDRQRRPSVCAHLQSTPRSDPHELVQLRRRHAPVEETELAFVFHLAGSIEKAGHRRAIE